MTTNTAFQLRFLCLVVAAMCATGSQAQLSTGALPTGGTVAGGQASIVQSGTTLSIHQTSNQAMINFSTFNVGSAALVDIRQPGAAAALLARVTGQDPSQIYGQIQANGALWLINPAGIMVGQGARIDVGSFIASTLNVSDADFLAGRLTFTSPGGAGTLHNAGAIHTASGGRIYLVAPKVENTGTLTAPNGEVLLAAAQNVQLVDTGHPGVSIALSGAAGEVKNMGRIVADAGRIGLGGALVTNAGEISASSAVREGGRVFLRATALKTTPTSDIHANGTSGGNVVLAADRADIDGQISAAGSAGPGGFVDTSGHASLNVQHAPTVGRGGEWLIDPSDLEVVAGNGGGASVGQGIIVSTENGTTIGADAITAQLNLGASVALITGGAGNAPGNINVNAAITKTSGGDARLTMRAHNDITINAPISSSSGTLDLSLKNNFYGGPTETGHVATINADIRLNGGAMEVSQGEALGNGTLNIAGGTTLLDGPGGIRAAAVNVQPGGRVTVASAQNLRGAWTNTGDIDVMGDGAIAVSDPGARLVNGGRITLSGTSTFVLDGSPDVADLINNGEIVKASSAIQQITGLSNGADGRITVNAGRLTLDRSTLGGSVSVGSAAQLIVDDSRITGGASITGSGAMTWAGSVELLGNVTLGANAPSLSNDAARSTLVRGQGYKLTTYNPIGLEGSLVLDGGLVWDNHGAITVGQGQVGNLAFNANAVFNNKAGGLVDVKDGSRLELSTQTTINNEAGALLQVDASGTSSFSGGYQGKLVNSGTIVKTGAGFTSAMLTNLAGGTLQINDGAFGVTFSENNPNAGTVAVASGAALQSTVDLHNAGTIRGTGSIELGGARGATLVNSGVLAPGGSGQVGTLAINGNFSQGPLGTLIVRLGATRADALSVTGAVQLAGTVKLSTFDGGLPTPGVVADFLVAGGGRTGAFAQVDAPAVVTPGSTGTLSVVYPETGTAVAQVKATTAATPVVAPPVDPPVITPTPAPAPSSDICTIAPNSALCQILSPPTASEPAKPVQQASNEVIKTITSVTPFKPFNDADPKLETTSQIAASVSKEGVKQEPVKKMYCN